MHVVFRAEKAARRQPAKPLFSKAFKSQDLSKMHYLFGKEYMRKLKVDKCSLGGLVEKKIR